MVKPNVGPKLEIFDVESYDKEVLDQNCHRIRICTDKKGTILVNSRA
jgi:hypothetical protein